MHCMTSMIAVSRLMSFPSVLTCIKTLPGPVRVVEQHPSPPQQHIQRRPFGVIPNVTVFSIMVTERLSTVTVSPSFSCVKMGVPPDATNKTLSFSPLIFWRQHPKPAQQQVFSEQSKSQAAKMNKKTSERHPENELLFQRSV
jgi:hypothetical protein